MDGGGGCRNGVLRTIFGPKRHEIIGDWTELHHDDPHTSNSSIIIIAMNMSRKM
jgi:hypothetical protein